MALSKDLSGRVCCEICMTYGPPGTYRIIDVDDVDEQGHDCLEPVAICEECAMKVENAR